MIELTAFKNRFDNVGQSFEKTWEHIIVKLKKPYVISEKGAAPLVSPVKYVNSLDGFKKIKDFKNAKGKSFSEWQNPGGRKVVVNDRGEITRSNMNVEYVTMLIFDFDSGNATPENISKPWAEYNHIVHSTWSHTAEKGKYRLIVPLKDHLVPMDFKNIWDDVKKIAGEVDESCKDPARMFYWPSHKPGADSLHYFHAVSDKKFYSPKIKKPPKKKIKRGDYKTLDVVKFFSSHEHYLGQANKTGQHWVKCPWQSEHTSETSMEDAVVWETTGENWPTFQCSHNTCRQNERNITQVVNMWGDADNFCTRALAKDSVKTDTKVKCLGHDDNGYYYYQSAKTNHVVRLRPESHKELNFYDITPDPDFWYKNWGKEENGRVDWKQAARAMMEKCQNAGFFKPISVRGAGCWTDDQRVVVHLGDRLRVGNENIRLTEFKSDYIYESAVQSIQWKEPLSKSEAFKLCEIINNLPIPNKIEKFLLSGHCVASILSGCLRWRPHVWITGDSGSGKTTIVNDVLNRLWSPIGGIFLEGRTTEAGVRQKIKHNSVPIIIDEVEANSKEEAFRVDSLVAMARSSSSNSAGNVAKGTISGHGLDFLVKSCFTFSSVAEALHFSQDKERFLVISVIGTEESKKNWRKLRPLIQDTLTKEYSLRFFSRCASMADKILKNCDAFHDAIIERFPKADSRNADQVCIHAACAWSLRSDEVLTVDQAIKVLEQQGDDQIWARFWSSDETNTALQMLDGILSRHLRGDSGRNYSVGELINMLKNPNMFNLGDSKAESEVMQRYGMIVEDDFLWISKTNVAFKMLFQGSVGATIVTYMKNMKGIQSGVRTFLGIQNPSFGVPLDVIFRKR